MMVSHLVMGVLVGLASGSTALALGGALWQVALLYVLGVNLGIIASALAAWLRSEWGGTARRRENDRGPPGAGRAPVHVKP